MKVKLRRGPMAGQIKEMDGVSNSILIQVQQPQNWREPMSLEDMFAPITVKRGEYYKTHETTKQGIRIFEWLGWMDD